VEPLDISSLDTGYLALFVGGRVNAIVMERLAARGYDDLKESDGYVFQHLVDGSRSISELARRMGVTQQAASKQIADLVQRALVTVRPARDSRARDVALAERGRKVLAETRKLRRDIESDLSAACTKRNLRITREALAAILTHLGGLSAVRERRVRQAVR
jgi:DNA-binding MarR family transcriptional regulator